MLGLIIFGTRSVTSDQAHGDFFCPQCRSKGSYIHKESRRYFTLYFIPLIPLNLIGEYIECQRCMGTYKMEVLQLDPVADAKAQQSSFHKALGRVLAMISHVDGKANESEISAIAGILGEMGNRTVSRAEIEAELAQASASNGNVVEVCRPMMDYLTPSGRELVIRASVLVASADGEINDGERTMLASIASGLQISRARLAELMPAANGSGNATAAGAASPPT